jgi:hypothetical protein
VTAVRDAQTKFTAQQKQDFETVKKRCPGKNVDELAGLFVAADFNVEGTVKLADK